LTENDQARSRQLTDVADAAFQATYLAMSAHMGAHGLRPITDQELEAMLAPVATEAGMRLAALAPMSATELASFVHAVLKKAVVEAFSAAHGAADIVRRRMSQ
jgi:hypothetical protein